MADALLAEAAAEFIVEIINRGRPDIWQHILKTPEEESNYIKWCATAAFHWANKALDSGTATKPTEPTRRGYVKREKK